MRQKLSRVVIVALLMVLILPATTSATPTVQLDGKKLFFEVPPMVDNGRTLVPLRAIFEAMGAVVTWDPASKSATAISGDKTVIIKIGSTMPTVNGKITYLDVPAKIVNGRTLAPLRFVGEAFGGTVTWDPITELITIKSPTKEALLGTRNNPVPMGKTYLTKEGLEITVNDHNDGWSAWHILNEANMFNDEPGPMMKYTIITFTVKNASNPKEYIGVNASDFKLIGSSNRLFNTWDKSAVLEDEGPLSKFDETLYHGGWNTGSACFYVPQDESNMLLIWSPFLGDRIYFKTNWS